ncbi:DUF4923 family protein [bacterium]|nr:DUF4923 family protein [bacterium]
MKVFKVLILILGLISISMLGITGCDKASNTGPTYEAADIIGNWMAQNASIKLKMTSSTTQDGVNPLEKGSGGIAISGDLTGTLEYQLAIGMLGTYTVMLTSQPLLNTLDLDDVMAKAAPTTYQLDIEVEGTPGEATLTYTNGGTNYLENADGTGFGFDMASYATSATQAQMQSGDGTVNAALNGTLTPASISFKKDDAKTITSMSEDVPANQGEFVINEDGTFNGNFAFDEENVDAEGNWTFDDNVLTLTVDDAAVLGFELSNDLEADVDFDGDDMILTFEVDLLSELETIMDEMEEGEFLSFDLVKAIIESVFGMNLGTLKAIPVEISITLSPATAAAKTNYKGISIRDHVMTPFRNMIILAKEAQK